MAGDLDTFASRDRVGLVLEDRHIMGIRRDTYLSYVKIREICEWIFFKSLQEVIPKFKDQVLKYTPKATSQLRDSILESLDMRFSSQECKLRFGSTIDYIKYVAYMKEKTVRHFGGPKYLPQKKTVTFIIKKGPKAGQTVTYQARQLNTRAWRWVNYYGYHGYIQLYDPIAQGGFFGKLILLARNLLWTAILRWTSILAHRSKTSAKPFIDQFNLVFFPKVVKP